MSDEMRAWLNELRSQVIGSETAALLIDKCEELAGLVEMFYQAFSRDDLEGMMMALDKAEAARRAPGGGKGEVSASRCHV